MKIIYGKNLTEKEIEKVNTISKQCGILFDTARLLFYRGIDTVEKAKRFLNPGKYGFHDPYLLSGMNDAVNRIRKAQENDERVLVFGDYDADGVCATAVLYYCLREFGLKVETVVPERDDGYGLNIEIVKRIYSEKKINLLITVDCGISDCDKVETIKQMGIDVIITDHHEPPNVLPNTININPKLPNQSYPFTGLCGACVAYKLGYALLGEKADDYLDFVALATVADSMDLVDENRDIVVEGLKLFNSNKIRPAFKYFLSDFNRQITSHQTLAYTIAPRINAGGRMGDANLALRLFIAERESEIFDCTAKLNEYNISRQVSCDMIYHEAKEKIEKTGAFKKSIIIVSDKKWNAGFIGIVASKLVEDYGRPVIVFAGHDNYLKGSARSIDGINIHDAILQFNDYLLGFGGHSQAAGLSIEEDKLQMFNDAINCYLKDKMLSVDCSQSIYVEWNVDNEISHRFAKEIELLEPFGVGNRKPYFSTDINSVDVLPLKSGSPHYVFSTNVMEMLNFNGKNDVEILSLPVEKKVVFEINFSTYKNRDSIKGYVRSVLPLYKDLSVVHLHIFENNIKNLVENNKNNYIEINCDDVDFTTDHGALYVVSDPCTLEKYDTLSNFSINLFEIKDSNAYNCVVVSPRSIPNNYNKVIYLDKPMQTLTCEIDSFVVKDVLGYTVLDKVSIERSSFAKIFTLLKNNKGKKFVSASDFYYKYINDGNGLNFVFATTVFIELKIFEVKNGILFYNDNIKNPLTNSKVYSKICLLKG